MKSPLTTLCYIEKDDKYLMLHRVSKKNDVNKDKWIGIGGHFEEGESPEECLLREAWEETGLCLTSWRFRGILTFVSEGWPIEYICLYTADGFYRSETNPLHSQQEAAVPSCESTPKDRELEFPCNEGVLEWIPKSEVTKLNLWEGDKIFLKLLAEEKPFFSMKLMYRGDVLTHVSVDGKPLELLDVCDEQGIPTGKVTERSIAHTTGSIHRTAHVWVVRQDADGRWQVLLQKRSMQKDSFPGALDTSSAGHISAGDEPLASARRELQEELGITASEEELIYAGSFDGGLISAEFDGKPFLDHEIASVYIYDQPIDADSLQLQREEVESVQWMDYETCRRLVTQGDPRFCLRPEGLELVGRCLNI